MKKIAKSESEILKTATDLVAEQFGIDRHKLKLAFKEKNGIFLTFQFTSREKEFMESHKNYYHVTMNVAGIAMDIYKN